MLMQSLNPEFVYYCHPVHGSLLWISSTFGICIPSYLALASLLSGTCSIISNLVALLPQIITNYNRGEVGGLTPAFLAFWFIGDLMNFVAPNLTRQATWQRISEGWHVSVDLVLIAQFVWYSYWRLPKSLHTADSEPLLPQLLEETESLAFHGDRTEQHQIPKS